MVAGGNPDAGDAMSPDGDGPIACVSYSSLFDTCAAPASNEALTLTPGMWTYNTDTHVLSNGVIALEPTSKVIDATAGPIDVIFVASFTLPDGATLRAIGPIARRPFGIAASGPVQIDGVLDVSSDGAGARSDAACGALFGTAGESNNGGAGGGGGGAFQGAGGGGSDGNADAGLQSQGGAGGTPIGTRPASPIGGCDGGRGGGTATTLGGDGGNGGGAVYVASGTSISVGASGVIDANGRGGFAGGNNGDAGGGGGSGGMILVESTVVTIAGIVVANGGGGGEGNTNGNPGETGRRTGDRASGGRDGDDNGGDGGDGGARTNLDGVTTDDLRNGGGGGGGGGAGFIAIGCPAPATNGATISPAFAPWP